MKIDITTNSDGYDCETCGGNWAEGGYVTVDGELVIYCQAVAHCYSGTSYSVDDLLVMALHKLGHHVYVDGEKYHVTCHNDEYHGKMED